MADQDREELGRLLAKHSVRRGQEFTLSSGATSDFYVDCKATLFRAEAMARLGRAFLAEILRLGAGPDAAGGEEVGAIPIAQAIATESYHTAQPINAFFVRKQPKGHGTDAWLEGPVLRGSRVVILEDVVTTGKSTIRAIERAEDFGLEIVQVVALVDRQEGGRACIEDKVSCPVSAIFTRADLERILDE